MQCVNMWLCVYMIVCVLSCAHNTPPLRGCFCPWGVFWCGQVSLVCRGPVGSIAMSVHLCASLWGQQGSHLKELCETDRHQQWHLAHEGSVSINTFQFHVNKVWWWKTVRLENHLHCCSFKSKCCLDIQCFIVVCVFKTFVIGWTVNTHMLKRERWESWSV